jgi:geranylgeranyl diphosphate synthase, type I
MDREGKMSARPDSARASDLWGDRPSTFDALLGEVRRRLDEELATWLRPRVASAAAISAEVGVVAEAVSALALRGGKRMRAALVAAGFEVRGASDDAVADWGVTRHAMLAIELLQTYLLIHDDWMDDDDVRRGGPSVHVHLRERLGTKALGDAAAVLAGDIACGYAQEALLTTALPPDRVREAARVFARIQVEVVTGQLAEMSQSPSVETIHALKTASYTVTGPLLLGAALAGASDARCAEIERFGRPLGIAFQLRDDLLGVFGDPSATGKPIWSDIRQGKRTALVTELRRDRKAEELLRRAFGKPDAAPSDVEAVVELMVSSGARDRVEARVRELSGEAAQALEVLRPHVSPVGHAWLAAAITALGERAR